ncbi:GatB/YqeY domain-containing protein [Mucilaginibacter sp. RS28]|uniref:GatB/YqeY domain-containing protein n=1 Tax=Mucilaginibacter straminoryzae TaxID=2932774 RepID=A0A9X2BDB7_9SPHI|nr:GatB/YqeY domain-containing protein [Mucilaginibacter straminoryzae]MCJ8210153.1 GatB/YqeY domain-containing protein [Mucilaginibacter straminoryzae]
MSLSTQIDQDIKQAMLARDQVKLRGLRGIKSALLLLNTSGQEVNEAEELKLLQKLVKQRKESAEIYKNQGREDLAEVELEEVSVIELYLPKQLSREEIEVVVKKVIEATGANSKADMGKVMSAVNKELAGKAEGKTISEVVKQLLA